MAASNVGPVQIYHGQLPPTIIFYKDGGTAHNSSFVNPVVESYSIAPFADHRELVGASGEVTSTRTTRSGLECTLQIRPEGTTAANARLSGSIPSVGNTAAISGMAVIKMGTFLDAWNVSYNATPTAHVAYTTDGTTLWHVVSVSPMTGGPQDPQMYSVTMRRYAGLASNVVVAD